MDSSTALGVSAAGSRSACASLTPAERINFTKNRPRSVLPLEELILLELGGKSIRLQSVLQTFAIGFVAAAVEDSASLEVWNGPHTMALRSFLSPALRGLVRVWAGELNIVGGL
jgi:hypothetical protein